MNNLSYWCCDNKSRLPYIIQDINTGNISDDIDTEVNKCINYCISSYLHGKKICKCKKFWKINFYNDTSYLICRASFHQIRIHEQLFVASHLSMLSQAAIKCIQLQRYSNGLVIWSSHDSSSN